MLSSSALCFTKKIVEKNMKKSLKNKNKKELKKQKNFRLIVLNGFPVRFPHTSFAVNPHFHSSYYYYLNTILNTK